MNSYSNSTAHYTRCTRIKVALTHSSRAPNKLNPGAKARDYAASRPRLSPSRTRSLELGQAFWPRLIQCALKGLQYTSTIPISGSVSRPGAKGQLLALAWE